MQKNRAKLHVKLFKEDSWWIAECEELDYVLCNHSLDRLIESLGEAIVATFEHLDSTGELESFLNAHGIAMETIEEPDDSSVSPVLSMEYAAEMAVAP